METVDVKLEDGTVVPVPMPRVPPKSRIKWSKRRKLARQRLRQFSQSLSADRVDSLAMYVGKFHPKSQLGKIASTFVAQNRLPVCEEVMSVYLRKRAAEIHRESVAEEELEDAVRLNASLEAQVLKMIDIMIKMVWVQLGQRLMLRLHLVETLLRY